MIASMGWKAALLLLFAGIVALCMLVLLGDWLRRWFLDWREARDLRVRDERHRWELLKPYEPSARERRL